MSAPLESKAFEVTIHGLHALRIPEGIIKPFLDKGIDRVRAEASFEEKTISFHAALQKWQGAYLITFSKSKQKELGVYPNDYFRLQLFEDFSKYGVDMPEELAAVLESDPVANSIFEGFTAGKKRSVIYMIKRYSRSQTKIDKSLLLCENMKKGVEKTSNLLKS